MCLTQKQRCDWGHWKNNPFLEMFSIINSPWFQYAIVFFPSPSHVLAFSLFFPFTCIPPPLQPLPLSSAGYREGEGKPSGADRALFQGAAWTGSLWQHQERRHTCPNVSKLR